METNPENFEHRMDCQGATIDTVCLGCLLSERDIGDAAMESLRRIVEYYDNRKTPEYGMDMQAKARHEDTMFGEARALLAKVPDFPFAGWTVSHPKYGKWFISRAAVIADWKQDRAQAYPDEPAREPADCEVATWWSEQTSWFEVAAYGKQIERPDMAAHEAAWLLEMARDSDYVAIAEIKALAEKNAAVREADGCYDDELLAECMSVLEYATYHDGRYRQDQSWEKFQRPAQKLVERLETRLGRKAYDGFGG